MTLEFSDTLFDRTQLFGALGLHVGFRFRRRLGCRPCDGLRGKQRTAGEGIANFNRPCPIRGPVIPQALFPVSAQSRADFAQKRGHLRDEQQAASLPGVAHARFVGCLYRDRGPEKAILQIPIADQERLEVFRSWRGQFIGHARLRRMGIEPGPTLVAFQLRQGPNQPRGKLAGIDPVVAAVLSRRRDCFPVPFAVQGLVEDDCLAANLGALAGRQIRGRNGTGIAQAHQFPGGRCIAVAQVFPPGTVGNCRFVRRQAPEKRAEIANLANGSRYLGFAQRAAGLGALGDVLYTAKDGIADKRIAAAHCDGIFSPKTRRGWQREAKDGAQT